MYQYLYFRRSSLPKISIGISLVPQVLPVLKHYNATLVIHSDAAVGSLPISVWIRADSEISLCQPNLALVLPRHVDG